MKLIPQIRLKSEVALTLIVGATLGYRHLY